MESFKDRLQATRKEKRLSQQDLANLIGKSGKAVISSWEVGNAEPSMADLRKLADALGTTLCWLLDGLEEGKAPMLREAPEGFALIPLQELVELQRTALQYEKIKRD